MTSRIGQTRFLGKSGARSATSLSNSIHGTSPEYSSSTPTVVFIEARARSLGFPAISLREWKQARKALGVKGRGERNDEQITKTALAQRQLVDEAIAKTGRRATNAGHDKKYWGRSGFRLHDWYRFTHTNRLGTHGAAA